MRRGDGVQCLLSWGRGFIYFLTVLLFNVVYYLSSNNLYLLDTYYTLQEL